MTSWPCLRSSWRAALAVLWAALSGCAVAPPQDRQLLITEVHDDRIELYLNEPPTRSLPLGGTMGLWTTVNDGGTLRTSQVSLSTPSGAPLQGGEFFILWEDSSYSGPPVAEPFPGGQLGAVRGIKLARRTLGRLDDFPSEVGIGGAATVARRLIIVIPEVSENRIARVVRFGLPERDRPHTSTAASFRADGSLANPSGSLTLQLRWIGGQPASPEEESHWVKRVASWGVPTQ